MLIVKHCKCRNQQCKAADCHRLKPQARPDTRKDYRAAMVSQPYNLYLYRVEIHEIEVY